MPAETKGGFLPTSGRTLRAAAAVWLGLAAWNVVVTAIADESYRLHPGRAVDLFMACLGWYLPLAALPVIVVSAILLAVSGATGRRTSRRVLRSASIPAGVAAGFGLLLAVFAASEARGDGGTLSWSGPQVLDLALTAAAAVAIGLLAAHLSAAASRRPRRALAIRNAATLAGAIPVTLLCWEMIRTGAGGGGSILTAAVTALASILAGLALALAVRGAFSLAGWAARRMGGLPRGGVRSGGAAAAVLFIAGVTAAVVGFRAGTPARAQSGAGRNVLVLVADTLRADHVGCYGARRTRTPNIDALAKRGTRIGSVSAVSAWTAPNTASILTGLYPDRHGLLSYHDRLDPGAVSFAQVFRRAGYETAGFSANPILSPRIGFGAGFDVWDEDLIDAGMRRHPGSPLAATLRLLGLLPPPERFPRADEMVDRALHWLDRPHDAPFLLYLQFMDAHDPYDPPPPFDTMYGAGTGFRMKLGTLSDVMAARLPAGPRELRTMEDLYDGAVSFMDDRIGYLLGEMARRRLLDDTLVVFTSDHGEEFLDHGDLEHTRTLYQEIVHTPLIFAGPGVVKGGVIDGPVPSVDIAPTLIDGAGLGAGGAFDGTSLWPALMGAAPPQPAESFMSLLYFGYRSPYHALVSVRSGDLKLLGTRRSSTDSGAWGWQLFDIAADPGETRDLSAGRASDLATLRRRVEAWQKRPGAVERKPKKEDSEIERRLRTLGYVD